MNRIAGVALIIVGVIGLVYGGISYTTRETVVDLGPIQASRDKTHNLPLSPIGGALALLGGVVLIATGKSK